MTAMPPEGDVDRAEGEASGWLARIRGPGGEEHADAFERWYMADPVNADAYDRVLQNWQDMGLVGKVPVGEARARFFDAGDRSTPRRRFAVGLVAVVLFVSLAVGAMHFAGGPTPLIPAAYATEIGQIRTIRLADGSAVTLDTDSAIQVSSDKRERRLKLVRGRARFAVADAGGRPFSVAAADWTIVATGTIFDVDVAGSIPSVSLIKGTVRVVRSFDRAAGRGHPLRAGQTLALTADPVTGQAAPDTIADTHWISGMVSFENATLADVVRRANLYGRRKIVLADVATRKLRFTGTFRATETQALARILAATFKLHLQTDNAGNVILSGAGS